MMISNHHHFIFLLNEQEYLNNLSNYLNIAFRYINNIVFGVLMNENTVADNVVTSSITY